MKTINQLCLLLLCLFTAGCATTDHSHGGSGSHGGPGATVETLLQSAQSWDGAPLPAYPDEAPQISVLKITIPPHSELPWHRHPCINAGYLISGELVVRSESGQTRTLKAGDALIEMVNTWHYGRNDGDVPAEIVVVYAAVEGQPLAILCED